LQNGLIPNCAGPARPVDVFFFGKKAEADVFSGRGQARSIPVGANATGRAGSLAYLRAFTVSLRPHQWSKNALVFIPCLIIRDFSLENITAATMAFAAFCLAGSSGYLFNDLRDLASDRMHSSKRNRPIANGSISPAAGYGASISLFAAAIAISSLLNTGFQLCLAAYVAGTLAYSLWAKRLIGLDVTLLACLYTIRVVAGDEVVGADLVGMDSSEWLLGFSCLFFLSLALVKRCSELIQQPADHANSAVNGRSYLTQDLPILFALSAASGIASMAIFARYVGSNDVLQNFSEPRLLWLILPVFIYWLVRLHLLANRGLVDEDPVLFAFTDRCSLICGGVILVLMAIAW
jgi:4-hydroxybenzoate polyprenyltransferase